MEAELETLATAEEAEKALLNAVLDGEDVRNWVASPIGKVIVRKAKDDYMDALVALADVSLTDDLPKARELQMKAQVSVRLIKYLATTLHDGNAATEVARRL